MPPSETQSNSHAEPSPQGAPRRHRVPDLDREHRTLLTSELLATQAKLIKRQGEIIDRGAPANGRAHELPASRPLYDRVDAITAALRYPLLVILPLLILGGLGAVLAHRAKPSYSAESQVLVGEPAPASSGQLPGVVQAEQSLAGIDAREITFAPIVDPLARRLHTTPGAIASRLSASPLPGAPIIKVDATGPDRGSSLALANAAGKKLAQFVNSQGSDKSVTNRAMGNYQQAATALAQARAKESAVNQSHPGSPNDPAVVAAQEKVQIAQLMANVQANQFQGALVTQQNLPTLTMFRSASSASSNRTSNLELYAFGGAIAGLVIGVALATLLANRRAARAALRPTAVG